MPPMHGGLRSYRQAVLSMLLQLPGASMRCTGVYRCGGRTYFGQHSCFHQPPSAGSSARWFLLLHTTNERRWWPDLCTLLPSHRKQREQVMPSMSSAIRAAELHRSSTDGRRVRTPCFRTLGLAGVCAPQQRRRAAGSLKLRETKRTWSVKRNSKPRTIANI